MRIQPLRADLQRYVIKHGLSQKWNKALKLFSENIRHPSLNTELLEPRWRGIYSFRIDKKHRALFFMASNGEAEVFQITKHYQ